MCKRKYVNTKVPILLYFKVLILLHFKVLILLYFKVLIILFIITLSTKAYSIQNIKYNNIPLYLENYINHNINTINQELENMWRIEIKFPLIINVERVRELGAKGEASFDGKNFRIFLTPITEQIPTLLKHEMMHIFTFQWAYDNEVKRLPLWVVEGIAVWYENRNYKNIININPYFFWKESDIFNIEEYPEGDAFYRYYDILADFFFFLDQKIDLKKNFKTIFDDSMKNKDYKKAFGMGEDIYKYFKEWRTTRLILNIVNFLFINLSWFIPGIIVIVMGIYLHIKRQKIQDTFSPSLEKKYGKEYWIKKDDDKES